MKHGSIAATSFLVTWGKEATAEKVERHYVFAHATLSYGQHYLSEFITHVVRAALPGSVLHLYTTDGSSGYGLLPVYGYVSGSYPDARKHREHMRETDTTASFAELLA